MQAFFEHYPHYHYLIASAQLVVAMLGMGATLRLEDFVEVIREPRPVLTGVGHQLLAIPLITLAYTRLLDFPPEIMVGFFMLASVPGGSMSNVYTYYGRGNAALSIALTGSLTLAALLTTPLILRIFAAAHLPPEIPMPAAVIMREIALYLLLPLSVGMSLKRWVKNIAPFAKWTIRASLVLLSILVIGSVGSGKLDFGAYPIGVPALVVLYCLLLQTSIGIPCRTLFRFRPADTTALAIESSMKNMNLGLLIAASLFRLEGPSATFGAGVLFVLLVYGGTSLFLGAIPAVFNAVQTRKSTAATPP